MRLVMIAAALLLGACGMTREDMAAACAGYGFEAGTPDFARCVMDLDRDQRARFAAAAAASAAPPPVIIPAPTFQPMPMPAPVQVAPIRRSW